MPSVNRSHNKKAPLSGAFLLDAALTIGRAAVRCPCQLANGSAIILLAELVHPSSGVEHLLFAGEEGMAGGAYLHMKLFLSQGGTGDELVAAAAYDLNILVMRMNIRFHDRLAINVR
jgi:hypothetical protein